LLRNLYYLKEKKGKEEREGEEATTYKEEGSKDK